MPWKTSSVMEEKLRFVFEHALRERTMTELCERYEIARQTGYFWLRRYREAGVAGLMESSRAAHRHRNQMPEEIAQRVLGLRQAHMRCGPRKLKRILERDEPGRSWPAASTIGALLQREGLVVPRRKRVRTAPYSEPLAHADGSNRVWCADFKGWFRTADGERIDPLTISDAHSRYLCAVKRWRRPTRPECRRFLKRLSASTACRRVFSLISRTQGLSDTILSPCFRR
jgi:putative transposase